MPALAIRFTYFWNTFFFFFFLHMKGAGQTLGAKMYLAKWCTFLLWISTSLFTTEATMVQGELKDLTVPHRYPR